MLAQRITTESCLIVLSYVCNTNNVRPITASSSFVFKYNANTVSAATWKLAATDAAGCIDVAFNPLRSRCPASLATGYATIIYTPPPINVYSV